MTPIPDAPRRAVEDIVAELAMVIERGGTPDASATTARRIARRIDPLASEAAIEQTAATALAAVSGLGPLQALLADPHVDEVMINNGGDVWVERNGRTSRVGRLGDEHAPRIVERILAPLGRRLDLLNPIVDARLSDGSRVCAVIPPIAVDGLCLSVRRFRIARRPLADFGSDAAQELLREIVAARCNVVVSGATSSGKTSLLNTLTSLIDGERIITLEDAAELSVDTAHVLRLETRPATAAGPAAVTMTDLLRAALRLRPDRLVIGELRGAEVVDMLQAFNTGHDGSLTTCHANGAIDALRRIEALVVQHAPAWPLDAVRAHVRSCVDVVVHVSRDVDGRRAVERILQVGPPDEDHVDLLVDDRVAAPLRRGRR